eukprot:UN08386
MRFNTIRAELWDYNDLEFDDFEYSWGDIQLQIANNTDTFQRIYGLHDKPQISLSIQHRAW